MAEGTVKKFISANYTLSTRPVRVCSGQGLMRGAQSCPPNSNHSCYFPVGFYVYCSVDCDTNPSTAPLGTTTETVCKNKLTFLIKGMWAVYVTTETALPPRETDNGGIMGKAAFPRPSVPPLRPSSFLAYCKDSGPPHTRPS